MKVLNSQNEYGIKVPYFFVTSGRGKSEAERCIQLSKQLNIDFPPRPTLISIHCDTVGKVSNCRIKCINLSH